MALAAALHAARLAPPLLRLLLVVAGLGYVVDGVGSVASADYGAGVGRLAFVGEVVLLVWLLIRSRAARKD